MMTRLLLLLPFVLVNSMNDWTMFQMMAAPPVAKLVLWVGEKETARACQVACGDMTECTAISYLELKCYLLGDQTEDDGAMCDAPYVVLAVKQPGQIYRNTQGQVGELGDDPCIAENFPEIAMLDTAGGVCPRNDKAMMIRAVNETGNRVTFDNDARNLLTYDTTRHMWKLYVEGTSFEQWLVALTCAVTDNTYTCGCDRLPQIDASWGIADGVDARKSVPGACEDASHQLTYWGVKGSTEPIKMSPTDAANSQIACHAGIWVLAKLDNSDGWQITNATCSPVINRISTEFCAELGNDPCVTQPVPEFTYLDGDSGICPRDAKKYIIRGVNESGARITFDNDNMNVLSFDAERNMWRLFYAPTEFERWLVAACCVRTTIDCGCGQLPLMDASRGIDGVAAQLNAEGACEDRKHMLTYWGAKFLPRQEPWMESPSDAATFTITCQAGIWLLTKNDDTDGWQITNATSRDKNAFSAEMGTDPCVTQLAPEVTKLDSPGICPRDVNNYAIRAINETGARITLDNNVQNVLTFDVDRNMWKFSFAPAFKRWLTAVSCVTTTNRPLETCGCPELPPMYPSWDYPNSEAAQPVPGPCPRNTQKMTYWGAKYEAGRNPSELSAARLPNYQLACQAGIWLLSKVDNSDGWQVTNVTCWEDNVMA